MVNSKVGTGKIQDECEASCSIRKSESAQKIKGYGTQKGHLKELPVAKEQNNLSKEINNILLDYNSIKHM